MLRTALLLLLGLLIGGVAASTAQATDPNCSGSSITWDKCTSTGGSPLWVKAIINNNSGSTVTGNWKVGTGPKQTATTNSGMAATQTLKVANTSQNVTAWFTGTNPNPCLTTDTKNHSQITSTYNPPCVR